jgi:hypothetical protein
LGQAIRLTAHAPSIRDNLNPNPLVTQTPFRNTPTLRSPSP